MKYFKHAIRWVAVLLVAVQSLLGWVVSRLPELNSPQVHAYTWPSDITVNVSTTQTCPINKDILVYQWTTDKVMSDLYIGDSTKFHIFNTVWWSKVNVYNANNTLANTTFQGISNAKFKETSQVTWTYATIDFPWHKAGLNNRSQLSAQIVYKMQGTSYANQNAGNQSYQQVTNFNPANWSYTTTVWNYVGQGSPTPLPIPDECVNITMAFCGDGVVDNGTQGDIYEGPASNYNNIKFNKNEQCDDGNTNNNDSCRNDCTLPPANPVCTSLTLTPANGWTAPFNVNYTCVGQNSNQYSILVTNTAGAERTSTTANGNFSNLPAGSYTATCHVGGNTSPACTKNFTVTALAAPQCQLVPVVPTVANGGSIVSGTALKVTCTSPNPANVTGVQLIVKNANNQIIYNQTQPGSNYQFTVNNLPAANYTYECKAFGNGQSSAPNACPGSVTVTPPPVNSFCNNLVVKANPGNITVQNGVANPVTGFPLNLSYTTNRGGNAISCMLIELVNGTMITRSTINAGAGAFNYAINNQNVYWVKCVVDGIQPEGTGYNVNTCKMDFRFTTPQAIDLEIDKQHMNGNQSCESFNSWDLVWFKLIVTNKGPNPASNFTVKDYLPANFTFLSATNGGTHAGGTVTWAIPGPLAANQSITLYFTGKVTQAGNYSNKTEICNYEEAGEPQDADSNPCNMGPGGNPSEDDEDVLCYIVNNPITPTIDIELTKNLSTNQTMFTSGDNISFIVSVTNKGNTAVTNASVKDYLPLWSIVNVTASNGGVVAWNMITRNGINLAPNQTITFTVSGKAIYNPNNADPCNKAEAGNYESPGGPQDVDSNGFTMWPNGNPVEDDEDKACFRVNQPTPQNFDIELTKVLLQPNGTFNSGGFVWFKITLYNNSNVPVPTFQVRDYLPAGVQFFSATDGGQLQPGTQTVQRTINGGLGAYGTKILYLTWKILQAWWFDNCAEVWWYNGVSSNQTPKDTDSDPFNHPGQDIEDDEDCAGFDVVIPNNPTTCDSLTVTPTNGTVPFNGTYTCNATNANSYLIQLIQNGTTTTLGTTANGTFTINSPGTYTIRCTVNGNITSNACQKTVTTTSAPFIDLNIKKYFADNNSQTHVNFNSGDTISFKLIVGNSGNTAATNFTVKDYLPSSLQYISSTPNAVSNTPNGMGTTLTRNIASLAPGATTTITIQAKIVQALWDKNKTEVCDYEEQGEPQDPDSQPCNMGPGGMPSEDDEDMIMWDVNEPQSTLSCDSLTINPSTWTVPYMVNYTCVGTNAGNYVVKLFGPNIGANGQVVGTLQQGSFTVSNPGSYTVQCFVNGTTTSVACNKALVGTTTPPPPSTGTKCNYLTVTPNGGMSPLNVNFFCNWGYTSSNTNFPLNYVVNISWPNGFNQSLVTSGWNITLPAVGTYSFVCTVGGAGAPACNKTVNVVTWECPNGAINPPLCNECPVGEHLSGGMCVPCNDCIPNCPPGQIFTGWQCIVVTCPNGATNPPACNQCPAGQLLSGGQCVSCPSGQVLSGNQCVPTSCPNGAINPPACNQCPVWQVLSGGQCIIQSCPNGAINPPLCNQCPLGYVYDGSQCVPPTDTCSTQCLDLVSSTTVTSAGQTVNFTCMASGASTYQIWIFATGSSPLAVLQGPTASYTFASPGSYKAQCIVNGSIDYSCDYYKNYCLDTLTCAYKIKPGGGLCAIEPALAPFVTTFVPPANRATIPAPLEYCTPNEIATLQCYDNSNLPNIGAIKDKTSCNEMITVLTGSCPNGAINPPACNQCPTWYALSGGQCVIQNCPNGAINPPTCNQCPSGYSFNGYQCVPVSCPNGAINPPLCNQCPAGYSFNGYSCVINSCPNGAINPPLCNQCPSGYSYLNNSCVPGFNYCGNGVTEIGEDCDLWNSLDRTIKVGSNRGKICTTDCRIQGATNPPKCMDIDPPSINEGEYFPFWWNIDTTIVTTANSCASSDNGKVLASSMQCTFKIYNGRRGTTDPVSTFTIPCNTDQWFNNNLMKFWADQQSVKPFGRYVAKFDAGATRGEYGEYKIELSKITYSVCGINGTQSYDGTVCQFNFVVGEGYMIQRGATVSTLKDTSIAGYYGFSSNTPRFDLYLKGVTQSLTLSSFNPTRNMSYLVTDFVDKYDKLGENAGVGKEKVPGKSIYLYNSSVTLKDADINDNSTIIVKGGNLKLEGTIAKNVLYVVPNGTITFWGDANCDKLTDDPLPQIVQGIFVAGQGFASDYYLNTDSNKARCQNGGLKIRGALIGWWVDKLIENRRVVLNDWFEGATFEYKIQHILDGASLLINPNVTLWSTLPGADEVAQILGVEKR